MMLRRLLPLLGLLGLCMCAPSPADDRCIIPDGVSLCPGDIVFRCGHGALSALVDAYDTGSTYSHVGVVAMSGDSLVVVHAVPDEPDDVDGGDRVKADAPAVFFAASRARRGMVCRHADSVGARRASLHALELARRRVPFDHDYDAADTTAMYCTEMVCHVFGRAGIALAGGRDHYIPVVDRRCVLPSDIIAADGLVVVAAF